MNVCRTRSPQGQTLEGIARAQHGENWKAGLAQMALDNGLKLNQWGSPVLGVGKTLVLNDLSDKSEQELASLSRTGGRIVSNNDKGLAAKAELEERARQAAADKVAEAELAAQTSAASQTVQAVPAVAAAPEMREVPVYTAAGDLAGSEWVPLERTPQMSHGEQMRQVGKFLTDAPVGTLKQIVENPAESLNYAGRGVVGLGKGVVNVVPETLTQVGVGVRYLGAAATDASGLTKGQLDREIAQYGEFTGRVLEYDNESEHVAGFVGGVATPGVATKAVSATADLVGTVRTATAATEAWAAARAERAAVMGAAETNAANAAVEVGGVGNTGSSGMFYNVASNGVRGEVPLTLEQRGQVQSYLSKFDMNGVTVRWVDDRNLNTAYGDMFGERILNIGSDIVPGNIGAGTSTANSRVSINGTLAHELAGHAEAAMAGRTQSLEYLEEAQASIRAARFGPDLTSTE